MSEQNLDQLTTDLREAMNRAENGHDRPAPQKPVNEYAPGFVRPLAADAAMIHARAMEHAYLQAAAAVAETRTALLSFFQETDDALLKQETWLRSQGGLLAAIVHDQVEHAVVVAGAYARTKHPDQGRIQ